MSAPSPTTTRAPSTWRVTLFALLFVEMFSGVLQVYFTPIYTELGLRFQVSTSTVTIALTAFELATVVATVLFAKLGDVYGHGRILKINVAIVAVGSILIAVAPTFAVLVVGRVLQGSFAAFLPLMFGLVRERFDQDRTRRGVSYLTGSLLFGVVFGAVVMSLLLKAANGVSWVLWLPVVGLVIGFILLFLVGTPPRAELELEKKLTVDWVGLILLAFGLVFVLGGLTYGAGLGWASPATILIFVIGAALLVAWVVVDLRIAHPLVDMHYVFQPKLLPIYLIGFVIYFGAIGTQVLSSTFMALPGAKLGYGLGLPAASISLLTLPGLIVSFLAVISTASLGRKIGFRWAMFLGTVGFFVGYGGLVFLHGSLVEYLVLTMIAALGVGFIEASTRIVVVSTLREGEVSIGSGIYELAITIGGSVGSAVVAAIIASNSLTVSGQSIPKLSAFTGVWGTCAVLGLIVAVVAWVAAARNKDKTEGTASITVVDSSAA